MRSLKFGAQKNASGGCKGRSVSVEQNLTIELVRDNF